MTTDELFQGILDYHKDLKVEYERFLKFCSRQTGKPCVMPKGKSELKTDLIYYLLRRNVILARATKGAKATKNKKG